MQRRSPKKTTKYEIAEHAYSINPSLSQKEIHERIRAAIEQFAQREKYKRKERSLLWSLIAYAKENFLGSHQGNDIQIECYIYSTILNYLLNRAVKQDELYLGIDRLLESITPETKLHKAFFAWSNEYDDEKEYEIGFREFEFYAPRLVTFASILGLGAFLLTTDSSTQTKILISCLVGAGNAAMHYGSSIYTFFGNVGDFTVKKNDKVLGTDMEFEFRYTSARK
jgi:hypothetical protein